ncbi:hypothetical protein B0T25DRAFT_569165 [Lasiosphaeria hispida]|uniref:Uncharacterized protein n=1 Tax=Lasiosphaeria hispida TaxID=260671 RepID=A0AAJ0HK24_9PEZI|nr:hypothetical protein B0T25DRAFT_569165 [Lasiosphaeria hispida]
MPPSGHAQNSAAPRRLALQKVSSGQGNSCAVAASAAVPSQSSSKGGSPTVKLEGPRIFANSQPFPGAEHLMPTEFSSIPRLEKQIELSRAQLAKQRVALANLKKSIAGKEKQIRAQESHIQSQLDRMVEKSARRDQLIRQRVKATRAQPAQDPVIKREPSEPGQTTPPPPAREQAVYRRSPQSRSPPRLYSDNLRLFPDFYDDSRNSNDLPEWNPRSGGSVWGGIYQPSAPTEAQGGLHSLGLPEWNPHEGANARRGYYDPDRPKENQAGPRELRYSESPQKPRVKREDGGIGPEEKANIRRRVGVLRIIFGEKDRPMKREREESPPHDVFPADVRVKRVKLEPQSPKGMSGVAEREIIELSD